MVICSQIPTNFSQLLNALRVSEVKQIRTPELLVLFG
jgi:hypothetical protein